MHLNQPRFPASPHHIQGQEEGAEKQGLPGGLGLACHARFICLLASGWMPGLLSVLKGNLRTGKILSSDGIHHSLVMDLQSEAGFGNGVLETERWKSILDNLVSWMYYFVWPSLWFVFLVGAALFHALLQLLLTQSEISACAQRVCARTNVPPSKVMGKKHFQASLPRALCSMGGSAIKKKKKKGSRGPFREAVHWALGLKLFRMPVWR